MSALHKDGWATVTDGRDTVQIPPNLFRALKKFLYPDAPPGRLEVDFLKGGVCGVRATEVFK